MFVDMMQLGVQSKSYLHQPTNVSQPKFYFGDSPVVDKPGQRERSRLVYNIKIPQIGILQVLWCLVLECFVFFPLFLFLKCWFCVPWSSVFEVCTCERWKNWSLLVAEFFKWKMANKLCWKVFVYLQSINNALLESMVMRQSTTRFFGGKYR